MGTEKWQKLAGLRSWKILKIHRSAVMQKCQKLAGPQLRKNVKKMHRSRVMLKCQKLPCLQSRKNAKNSQVPGHGNVPKMLRSAVFKIVKTHRSTVMKYAKMQKCFGQQILNAKRSQVRDEGKMQKFCRSWKFPKN